MAAVESKRESVLARLPLLKNVRI